MPSCLIVALSVQFKATRNAHRRHCPFPCVTFLADSRRVFWPPSCEIWRRGNAVGCWLFLKWSGKEKTDEGCRSERGGGCVVLLFVGKGSGRESLQIQNQSYTRL